MHRGSGPFFKSLGVVILQTILMLVIKLGINLTLHKNSEITTSIASIIATIVVVSIFLFSEKRKLDSLKLFLDYNDLINVKKGIFKGLKYCLIFIAVSLVSLQYQISGLINENKAVLLFLFTAVISTILTVISKELLFRGYVLSYLREKYSIVTSVLLTSIIYSFSYLFDVNSSAVVFFNGFLTSIILSLLVIKYDSLLLAAAVHFIWRLIFDGILNFRSNAGLINFNYKNFEILNGGIYGVEGGLIFTAAGILLIFLLRRTLGFRADMSYTKGNRLVTLFMSVILVVGVIADSYVWNIQQVESSNSKIKTIKRFENVNNYKMEWKLDTDKKTMMGIQEVSYINNSKDQLKEVYFHIYPNAFSSIGGGITIASLKVDGEEVKYKIEGSDSTLLYVPLPTSLASNSRVNISMEYLIRIPQRNSEYGSDRFAYGINTFNLGNCFPIAAVYENGSWDKHLYDKKGDAFYSETSNFQVKIKTPKRFIVASSGEVMGETTEEKDRVWNISANAVRDFAFVASDKFQVVQSNIDGTVVKVYAFNKLKAQKVLKISSDAIKVFNKRFGEYPYPICSVVQTDLDGGMEYPNMVMINSNSYDNVRASSLLSGVMYDSLIGELEFTVVHELAHQWWYALVGNNEFSEAWLDEPLTQYSSVLYYEDIHGKKEAEKVYDRSIAAQFKLGKDLSNSSMKRELDDFEEMDYYMLIYCKGPIMYDALREEMGDEKFNKFTAMLYSKYKFKVIKEKDLIDTASEAAGKDMTEFFRKWTETDFVEY